jgi:hypothetical protein
VLPLQVKVLVPEGEILVGLRTHETAIGAATASVIVPVNPFCGATMIVVVPEVPLLKLRDAVLGSSVTSGVPLARVATITCTIAVWLCEPYVPVIVTV